MADALFNQADVNRDQRLDLNEFRNLLSQSLGATVGGTNESINYSSYDQSSSSFASANTGDVSGFSAEGFQVGAELSAQSVGIASSSSFAANASQQQVQVDPSNPKNLFQDPNPQIIRRPAPGEALTYTQNIRIRFLQPPPVPPPGPLIIKEVRPPQPPPPPPLRVRQQAPPLPPPPPLVLREKPPVPPAIVASQTVIRRLAALPIPPRSVIIERLPPAPPKPRDIIIERWLPYKAQAKRKTIVQRAEKAKEYPKPRNIIIQYEPIQVRVVRQFQRLGITQANPQVYIQQYGATLLDAQVLVQRARAAGVVEDISVPNVGNTVTSSSSSSSFNGQFNSSSGDLETFASGVNTSNVLASSSSSFESANAGYLNVESSEGVGVTSDLSLSYNASQNVTAAEGFSASSFESNSFGLQGGDSGFSTSAHGFNNDDDSDPATVAFRAADLNKDGALDANEFRQFLSAHLRSQ